MLYVCVNWKTTLSGSCDLKGQLHLGSKDGEKIESQSFKEPSAQWLDYNTQQQQKNNK